MTCFFWEKASTGSISTLHPETIIEETGTTEATTAGTGQGNPIIIGLSHTYYMIKKTEGIKSELNHDKSSDHYVIVVGRGYENGKRYFLYYEVGTSDSAKGQNDNNRLYVNDNNTITGTPPNNASRTYTVTQVRGNKSAGDFS